MLRCLFLSLAVMARTESLDDRFSGEELLSILSGDFPGDGDLPMNGGPQSGFPKLLRAHGFLHCFVCADNGKRLNDGIHGTLHEIQTDNSAKQSSGARLALKFCMLRNQGSPCRSFCKPPFITSVCWQTIGSALTGSSMGCAPRFRRKPGLLHITPHCERIKAAISFLGGQHDHAPLVQTLD